MATQSYLTDEDMRRLAEIGEIVDYGAKETILQQNSSCDRLYWIKSGVVQIDFSRLYGHDVLAYLGEGDLFGEVSLLLGTDTSANATATQAVQTLEVPHERLRGVLDEDHELAARFYQTLAHTLARRVRSQNIR